MSFAVGLTSIFSVHLHWEPVSCVHQNGEITGYIVKYWAHGRNTTGRISYDVSRTDVTVSNLSALTNFSFQVAAVNNAGTGVFSAPVIAETGN